MSENLKIIQMFKNLVLYLSQLNSDSIDYGIWVNAQNVDEFRIGKIGLESGGKKDNFLFIGNLNTLSFGAVSFQDCFFNFFRESRNCLNFKGKKIRINPESVFQLLESGKLDLDFKFEILALVEREQKAEALDKAWAFVAEDIPIKVVTAKEPVLV